MEKAILKTLIYADIFDYPLKAWEIHKWLIGKKASLKQVDKGLLKKSLELRIKSHEGYYFLSKTEKRGFPHFLKGRKNLVRRRLVKEKQSESYLFTAKWIGWYLRLVPWIKLLGVSGSVAIKNASKKDDIDMFVIAQRNRLWIVRFLILILLFIIGKRRKSSDSSKKAAGKICINLLLEENHLVFKKRNIYLAHEILQMRLLWQKDSTYSRYLEDNDWVFKFLPNWKANYESRVQSQVHRVKKAPNPQLPTPSSICGFLESLAKWFQLKYMSKPKGQEKILPHALYFHPENYQEKVLKEYIRKSQVARV